MNEIYTITGELIDDHTVSLDQPLPIGHQRVKLVVERLSPARVEAYRNVMARLRTQQQARNYHPPTKDQVDQYLHDERSAWDD